MDQAALKLQISLALLSKCWRLGKSKCTTTPCDKLDFVGFLFCFEMGLYYVVLAVLELALSGRLASNSEILLPLPPKC